MKFFPSILLALSLAAPAIAQTEVVATGLQAPQKFLLTPRGNFLVSETSVEATGGRISYVTRSGTRRSLFEGLPAGVEVTGGGSGPSALAMRGRTLYATIAGGDVERRNAMGASIPNPAGISSPIYSSILDIRFSTDVDSIAGTFRMTTAHQQSLSDGNEIQIEDGAGATARIFVLVDLPDSVREGTGFRFSNPWGLALTEDGATLWLTDASQNTLTKIDTATGRTSRVMRFGALPNPGPIGPPMIDSVPTGIRIYGQQLLVSFLTGFPFNSEYARVLAVNPDAQTTEPFILGVTSVVDVLWRERPGRSQYFVLEFSTNQSATPAPPGRLLRYDTADSRVVAADLRAPVSLAFDPATEEIFILELSGRILKVSAK